MIWDGTLRGCLAAALDDAEAGWSLGTFGAGAEFRRRADEPRLPLGDGGLGARTWRGGIALDLPEGVRAVAYETPIGDGWSHALALCLPAGTLPSAPPPGLAEIGPDAGALDPARRGIPTFDLGLGLSRVSVRVRTDDAALLALLRARLRGATEFGAAEFGAVILPALAAGAADLAVIGPLGRIEVAGGPGDLTGPGDPRPGPRAYLVPSVLALGRTHAATAPIPPGLVPCAHLHPPHPCRDAAGRPIPFDPARHAAFQALLARFGDPALVALKTALAAGAGPGRLPDRRSRAVARVARAQAAHRPSSAGPIDTCS